MRGLSEETDVKIVVVTKKLVDFAELLIAQNRHRWAEMY